MKKIILSSFMLALSISTFAQIVVQGISPASVVRNYEFDYGETSSGWAPALNFNNAGVHIQGQLVLVNDGTPGTNAQGNPISAEGCNALINGTDVNGKIAVVYRNTCEFGDKAKHAQDAGAIGVIIINRDPEVISIGGGTQGPNVTIPVVMLTSTDGLTLTNAMQTDTVIMFIGNKAGRLANDLSFSKGLILTPKYNGVHKLLADNNPDYFTDFGMRIFNYGSNRQDSATINAKITGPSGVVYDETVVFSLAGVTGNVVDSVDIFPGETLSFPRFQPSTYELGEYTFEYTLTPSAGADDYPEDNEFSIKFVVNDNYISRSRLDPTTLKPIVDVQNRAADRTPASEQMRYCILFNNANASRLAATSFQGRVSIDSTVSNSLLGKSLFFNIYKWNDQILAYNNQPSNFSDIESELEIEYTFQNDVNNEEVIIHFENPYYFENNQKYLFCFVDYGERFSYGFDNAVAFNANNQIYLEPANPFFNIPNTANSPAGWYIGGFGGESTFAFAIHAIDTAVASISKLTNLEGTAFPNPTTGEVKLNIPMNGKAMVAITDISGRIVKTSEVNFLNNESTVSLSELQNGLYTLNVAFENGSKTIIKVLKK